MTILATLGATLLWVFPVVSGSVPIQESESKDTPVSVEFSLDNGTGSLGEPIILKCRIANKSKTQISIDWQNENIAFGNSIRPALPPWLAVTIRNEKDEPVEPKVDKRKFYVAERISAHPRATYRPDEVREVQIVLSQWFSPRTPGTYSVQLEPKLEFVFADGQKGIYHERTSLKLVVGLTSYGKLFSRANSLKEQILAEKNFEKTDLSLSALLSMPDTVAKVWRSLLTDPGLRDRQRAIDLMKWKTSPAAIALREEMINLFPRPR